jgi:hypothetical protein
MSQATEPREGQGVAEQRAQRELTNRVGTPLLRRNKPSNSRWGTWRRRLGIRGRAEA